MIYPPGLRGRKMKMISMILGGFRFVIGVPIFVIIHVDVGCSLTKTIHKWGYPHDYGNPHINEVRRFQSIYH